MPKSEPPFMRFLRSHVVCPDTNCWLWEGATYANGYGWIKCFGKVVSAHRLAYELYKGPIPAGAQILHSCDIKRCVNPDHLRAGTHAENMAEASDRGRMPSGPDHHMYGVKNPRPKQANRCMVLGVAFDSQKEAERHFGLGSGTVRYWIKNNPSKAWLISGDKNVICK